jgi:hypothetical protein
MQQLNELKGLGLVNPVGVLNPNRVAYRKDF